MRRQRPRQEQQTVTPALPGQSLTVVTQVLTGTLREVPLVAPGPLAQVVQAISISSISNINSISNSNISRAILPAIPFSTLFFSSLVT